MGLVEIVSAILIADSPHGLPDSISVSLHPSSGNYHGQQSQAIEVTRKEDSFGK